MQTLCGLCSAPASVYCENDRTYFCPTCDLAAHASLPIKHVRRPVHLASAPAASDSQAATTAAPVQQAPVAPQLPSTAAMAKDGLSKVFDQAFEMDNSWLDRLDMGFDFSDILDDGTDGLVPSLSPTAAQAAAAAFAVPSLDDFELPTTNQLLQDRGLIGDDMHGVPMGGSPTFASAMAPHAMEFAPPQLQTLQQQVPMHQVPVPVATLPVAPPEGLTSILSPPATKPPPPPRAPAPASSSSYASTSSRLTTRSAAAAAAAGANGNAGRTALSIPNSEHLTREQRVQRWREKRKNRQFKKTIRYASRKAYAEVRPRIKGRFAKREEVDAWRAAEAAMAAGMPGMAHALGDDLAVPVM